MNIKLKIILVLLLIIGLVNIILWGVDSSSLPIKQGVGIITNKYIEPAHNINGTDSKYHIVIVINGISDNITLCISDYDLLSKGQSITCYYSNGRIFNTIYIQLISINV